MERIRKIDIHAHATPFPESTVPLKSRGGYRWISAEEVIGFYDKLDIEKGIGNITVDGEGVSNIKGQGNGNNSIEVNGGIGAINLKFKESEAK